MHRGVAISECAVISCCQPVDQTSLEKSVIEEDGELLNEIVMVFQSAACTFFARAA